MSAALSEIFWPPADELAEAAERIRARLGVWPASTAPARICLAPPEPARAGDVVVAAAGDAAARGESLARLTAAGAAVIVIDDASATLHAGGSRCALASRGPLADDWIAALAAFIDCGFDTRDALVLALAWRDGDEAAGAGAHRDDAHDARASAGPMRDAGPLLGGGMRGMGVNRGEARGNGTDCADPCHSADAHADGNLPPWPTDFARLPHALSAPAAPAPGFPPCPERLGLYAVLPSADWVERVLDCGVTTVQLRVKGAAPDRLRAEIERAVAASRRYPHARLFINDHWRLALEAGAYGVHLGQEDLDTADLAAIAQAGARLGLSSHGYYEMLVALHAKPSYLALGPVFATRTKADAAPPQGLARIARYARIATGRAPLVAIGGITVGTLAAVLATGVGSAAVVSAVTGAADYRSAIIAMQKVFAGQFDNL
ncbi:thiamine phosphate synthase [Burkholderia singularis]|uniref:thiamine phosphate synthase n=1 Tax=Burkholderia singularis TaxID=1503053 RepID=UPI000AAE2A07|nr:thiamine phosphate synthase [Burkholderia singularis]